MIVSYPAVGLCIQIHAVPAICLPCVELGTYLHLGMRLGPALPCIDCLQWPAILDSVFTVQNAMQGALPPLNADVYYV